MDHIEDRTVGPDGCGLDPVKRSKLVFERTQFEEHQAMLSLSDSGRWFCGFDSDRPVRMIYSSSAHVRVLSVLLVLISAVLRGIEPNQVWPCLMFVA